MRHHEPLDFGPVLQPDNDRDRTPIACHNHRLTREDAWQCFRSVNPRE
jgi:hypothetical protein